MKIAIVAIAKNEDLYILEWIDYYKQLGASHFFIFDNDDLGNQKLINLLKNDQSITLIDIRGRQALHSYGMQQGCYQKIYKEQKDNFDYFGFFDIDEFLYLNGKTISEFLSKKDFKDVDIIKFNWRYYGDNDLVFYDPRPVQERFPNPCPDNVQYNSNEPLENRFCKCLIKSGKEMISNNLHNFVLQNGICKHCSGKPGNMYSKYEDIDFTNGYVKHYGTKTIEEYIKRKCLFTKSATTDHEIKATTRLNWFFNINRHTSEKDALAKFFYDRNL